MKWIISHKRIIITGLVTLFFFNSSITTLPYVEYGILNNYLFYTVITFILVFNADKIFDFLRSPQKYLEKVPFKKLTIHLIVINILSVIPSFVIFKYLTYFFHSPVIPMLVSCVVVVVIQTILIRTKINYIKEIVDGVTEISKGKLDYKITVRGTDELKVLAENINQMSLELQRKIEDERRAEQTKNELITNVSHDLKTPLTIIIGYLTLLKDKKYDSETMAQYLEKAYNKSLKLKKLIEDLFEYTKVSNGVLRVDRSKVNLVELLEQQIGELSVLAKQKNISIEKDFQCSEIIVNIDPALMARVFENILSNAVKYSYSDPQGIIFVKITQEKDQAVVMVENQGDTIPTEMLPLIFERFYRVDKSRNSKIAGSGLGLAIAKSIVDLHGGNIYAESEGNRVRVYVVLHME